MNGHSATVVRVKPQVCLSRRPVFGSRSAGRSKPVGVAVAHEALETEDSVTDGEDSEAAGKPL